MNILLSDLPKNKNEIIDDSISHCMHLVDIDYLRPNENDKPDVNINPFNFEYHKNSLIMLAWFKGLRV